MSSEVTTTLTARRFLVAVGGRPSPLDVPGGELAITSDDLFMKKDPPGKVEREREGGGEGEVEVEVERKRRTRQARCRERES